MKKYIIPRLKIKRSTERIVWFLITLVLLLYIYISADELKKQENLDFKIHGTYNTGQPTNMIYFVFNSEDNIYFIHQNNTKIDGGTYEKSKHEKNIYYLTSESGVKRIVDINPVKKSFSYVFEMEEDRVVRFQWISPGMLLYAYEN